MSDFWQGAGGASAFNTLFEDTSPQIKGKVNTKNRTFGILSYIHEKQSVSIKDTYNYEIRDYLFQNNAIEKNKTVLGHLYKPSLFFGLIQENKNQELLLSLEGSLFLNSYKNHNFTQCKQIFINQLDNTTYPNKATPKSSNIALFPFRILFKLLLENGSISQDFINHSLVKITKLEDLALYIRTKDITKIPSYPFQKKYTNFNDWILKALVSIQVLDRDKERNISINKDVYSHIQSLYRGVEYASFFFNNETMCDINRAIAKVRYKRDARLITRAKERDRFTCQVNTNHTTFTSKGNNYVEGHHIIPMFQQKNYAFNLDDVDNISSLCPNCHREIHSGDDKTQILTKLYNLNKNYMNANSIDLNDLYKMYACA